MAIKQQVTSVSGATTEYHRISHLMADFTERKAEVVVASYLNETKRDEEKSKSVEQDNKAVLMEELDELVTNATEENEARRIELTNQINSLPEYTPDDVAPRNISVERHEITWPAGTDFNLEYVYNWLKENVYTSSQDC